MMRHHRVKYGETLATIAKKYYDDPGLYTYIYQHNRHYIQNVNQLTVGQVIVIPHLPIKEMVKRAFD